MRFFRSERVGKLIREQLAEIIQREIEFRHVLVTVTDVLVDKKLDHAKVMVSVICSQTDPAREQKIKAALAELEKNAGHLQI